MDQLNLESIIKKGLKTASIISTDLEAYLAHHLWFMPTKSKYLSEKEIILLKQSVDSKSIFNVTVHSWSLSHFTPSTPAVLLIHGWGGRWGQFREWVPLLLEQGFQVIAFDGPSHGFNPGFKTNVYEWSQVVLDIFNQFPNISKAITHSFGSTVLMHALLNKPIIKEVVFIAPPARLDLLFERFQERLSVSEKAMQKHRHKFFKKFQDKDVQRLGSNYHLVQLVDLHGIIIHDENDYDVPLSEGQLLKEFWSKNISKDIQLIKTTGLGHNRILRSSEAIEPAIKFLVSTV